MRIEGRQVETGTRTRWARCAVATLAVVASSCQSDSRQPEAAVPPRAESQDLRVAVGEDPFLRGTPPTPDLGLRSDDLAPGIFETLTSLTPTFGLTPGLAVRWEAETPSRWRFELRQDVRFHDGSPLTAEAVVATLQAVAGGFVNSELENVARRQSRPRGLEPDSARAEGEGVVIVSLSEANLRLPEQLANPRMAVQALGTRAGDGATPATTPTGTGPFRFVSYDPGSTLRVAANDDHWSGPPDLRSITFVFGPDEDASRLLAARQVDLVGLVPPGDLAEVSGRTDRVVESRPARSIFVLMNRGGVGEWALLRDDDLRRAVTMALDPEVVAETGWPDHGEPNHTLIPPVVLDAAAERVDPPGHDLAGAQALLGDAGWIAGPDGIRVKDGHRLTLTLLIRNRDLAGEPVVEAIGDQLAQAGIALELAAPDVDDPSGSALGRVNAATFDLFLDVRPQYDANPCALCRLFSIRPGGDLTVSGVVRPGPEVDSLFDEVYVAPSLAAARRVAARLMQVVITEEVVAVPLATLTSPWLVSPRVHGFQPAPLPGAQQWAAVWLSP